MWRGGCVMNQDDFSIYLPRVTFTKVNYTKNCWFFISDFAWLIQIVGKYDTSCDECWLTKSSIKLPHMFVTPRALI